MNKRETGGKPTPKPTPKPRSSASDNKNVNPIYGPIAQTEPNRRAWVEYMDGVASGSYETDHQRVKNIQDGARAAVKYGVSKTYKDGVSKARANLDDMLKPHRKKK